MGYWYVIKYQILKETFISLYTPYFLKGFILKKNTRNSIWDLSNKKWLFWTGGLGVIAFFLIILPILGAILLITGLILYYTIFRKKAKHFDYHIDNLSVKICIVIGNIFCALAIILIFIGILAYFGVITTAPVNNTTIENPSNSNNALASCTSDHPFKCGNTCYSCDKPNTKLCCLSETDNWCCPVNQDCDYNSKGCIDNTIPKIIETTPTNGAYDIDKYNTQIASQCDNEISLLWMQKSYKQIQSKVIECKRLIFTKQQYLNSISNEISADDKARYDYALASIDSMINLMNYWYSLSSAVQLDASASYTEQKQAENDLLKNFNLMIASMYKLKTTYPDFYSPEDTSPQFIEAFREFDHAFDTEYDTRYSDPYAKYFLKVDALNPLVITETDKLTKGLGGDDNAIEWKIFEYVRDSVTYNHDPNWQTDWAQSPAITIFTDKGDCDDHSILLASMFMRAGIQNVKLCYGDNHMWVAVDNTGWDATCKNCIQSSIAKDTYTGNCYEINSYINSVGKCKKDQTPYGECSTYNVGYYCNNGELTYACTKCGCANDYPYCNTQTNICVNCPAGTIWGKDNLCHQPCGSSTTYCETGSHCSNGQCYFN